MPEGRQSPPPERQSGKQLKDPPATGQRTDNDEQDKRGNAQLNHLTSNPKAPMDDQLHSKFAKTEGNYP